MKNTIMICVLTIAMLATACEDEFIGGETFLIRKGEHYASGKNVATLQNNKLVFDATFDHTAKYDLGDIALQSNKNKLLGFSDCNSLHHDNSARFAWQWFNGQLEIFAYCYVNGVREEKFVGVVEIDEVNHYEIQIHVDHYTFLLNNNEPVIMPRGNTCNSGVYYMLWPYFGGSVPAPHDVTINIQLKY